MLELLIPDTYKDHNDPFIQWVQDFLSWEWSQCDFEAHCLQHYIELWKKRGINIQINSSDEEEHPMVVLFGEIYTRNKKRVDLLINRHTELIHVEEYSEENDVEFRDIWTKIDKVVIICCKTINKICSDILQKSWASSI